MNSKSEIQLAFKITTAASLILISILWIIIASSFYASREWAYREFSEKVRMLTEWPRILNEVTKGEVNLSPWFIKKRSWPRDIVIIDDDGNIIKNELFDFTHNDILSLLRSENGKIYTKEIWDAWYFTYRQQIWGYSIFIFEDIERIYDFHFRLIVIALLGSLISFMIIFFLAKYLARLTIRPIQEYNRELESYSHNVAHELRTPLSVMRSNLELLRIKPENRFIQSTDDEISNMEHIIESLLFLAKPWMKKDEMEKINIANLTTEYLQQYKETKDEIQLNIKWTPHVYGKKELYKRMFSNLIENALKYKSEGKIEITIHEWFLEIKNHIQKDIPKEEIQKLTKSFYQIDTSRHTEWYGIGLALVEKIVKISGWKMSIVCKNREFIVNILF